MSDIFQDVVHGRLDLKGGVQRILYRTAPSASYIGRRVQRMLFGAARSAHPIWGGVQCILWGSV